MSEALRGVPPQASLHQTAPRILGVFARWRLLAYGYTFPVFYAAFFLYLYCRGLWLVNESGALVYHDFTLVLVPLAMLPYFAAFLTWESVTLVCCIAVVYLIVQRQAAISLMLAS